MKRMVFSAPMTARQQTCREALQVVMIASHGILAQVREGVPALATADIGIAISAGSDGAKEVGDLLLVGNDPGAVVTPIGLSGATIRKICQNLVRIVVHNSLGLPIAALGWLNPRIAAA